MNKDALTILGCSSSLAFMLLMSPAKAGTIAPQSVGFGATATTAAQKVDAPISQAYSQSTSLDPNSDTVGDLAIAKLGCDCPSCRNSVIQMIQSGRLALPQ